MADTIFTKIIKGEIPCHKVHEDDRVIAFLDINPLAPGHTLVVPKEAAATIDELSDDAAAAVGRVLPRIARAIRAVTEAPGCNILQNNGTIAGQEVPHVHFHVIPKSSPANGLGIGWKSMEVDHDHAAAMAKDIGARL